MAYEGARIRGPILLVSRDRDVQLAITNALTVRGFPLVVARGAQEGARSCLHQLITAVIVDLTLPNIDAFQLFQMVRSAPTTRLIPFIFLAAREIATRTRQVGERIAGSGSQDHWLGIPLSDSELDEALQNILGFWELEEKADPELATPPYMRPVDASGRATGRMERQMGELSGRIGQFQVGEILQIFERSRRTGLLLLGDGRIQGQVFFVDGAIHHAALEDIVGPDAVFLLLNLREGYFDFFPGRQPPGRTIHEDSTALLLEGLRQMDETRALMDRILGRKRGKK